MACEVAKSFKINSGSPFGNLAVALADKARYFGSHMMTKEDLRLKMREALRLPIELRAAKSVEICEKIVRLESWGIVKTVLTFSPQRREPDVAMLWPKLHGKKVVYPRVDGERLALHSVESADKLESGKWGILEPTATLESRVEPESVDMILVPGVAFTESGLRCGRGGGFYDRLLGELSPSAIKVGICFREQMVEWLPTEVHDRPVDLVISA
jgi:5-formyltetrahydrofolate cyclo-ligase